MDKNADPLAYQRAQHTKSFDLLKEALKLDETNDSDASKMRALYYYKRGIDETKKGIEVDLNRLNCCDAETYERAVRLREKMSTNLTMATERVRFLEDYVSKLKIKPSSANDSPKTSSARSALKIRTGSPSSSRIHATPKSGPLSPGIRPATTRGRTPATSHSQESNDSVVNRLKKIKGVDPHIAGTILDQVLDMSPKLTFDDIAGLEGAKRALQEAVILPAQKPELFTGLRSPVQGLLLFGPPGNGKTMLAKAVAAESKCVFFNISAAALTSKWVGEAEKLVKTLFVLARHVQPAIVFIDEIDSILCERSDKEHEVSRRLKTEFLVQFDGVSSNSSDRILIMGATNRPFDLDDAVLRRFPKRIFVGLPDSGARANLLQKLLNKHDGNGISVRDVDRIASWTDGYSNSDLTHLAKEAAMGPLREIPAERLTTINASQLRSISARDFEQALNKIRPSTKTEHLSRLVQFNKQYGELN